MKEEHYSLQSILDSITKPDSGKKRLIFDQKPLKGIGSKWLIAFFISLPFLLYIGIFNPTIFAMLGIAQAIIFFIVFLSMLMIMIFALAFINNNKVIRQIIPSWEHYFPSADLKLVLSSGVSPYKDFFTYYEEAINKGLQGDALHVFLENAFMKMQEENAELLEHMNAHKNAR